MEPEVRKRTRLVFTAVLNYVHEMLTTETMLNLPPDLTFKQSNSLSFDDPIAMGEGNDDYATVVFNDEYHRFDEVIETIPRYEPEVKALCVS